MDELAKESEDKGATAAVSGGREPEPPPGCGRPAAARPSGHYPPIEPPIDHIISRGTANYPAVAPRRQQARQLADRTLVPLDAHPLGPGRAQLLGELEDGATLYVGEVLAGQPHGRGREYLKGVAALNEVGYFLAYEGEWCKGRKTGAGTVHGPGGETYTGQLVDGQRQGQGRMVYANGDCYEGAWHRGERSGPGQLRSTATGGVFVGQFRQDRREGPGALYMLGQGQKYLAEYVTDEAKCGVWEPITAAELAALKQDAPSMLSSLAASKRPMPLLELDAPFEVLAASIQRLRQKPGRPSSAPRAHPNSCRAPGPVSAAPLPERACGTAGSPVPRQAVAEGCSGHAALLPLSGVELEALRLVAAREAAGSGPSLGGTVLAEEQLRRVQERLRGLLGHQDSQAACSLVEAAMAAGRGLATYDGLMAAACGAGNAGWHCAVAAAGQGVPAG